jgi:hypothetical protein
MEVKLEIVQAELPLDCVMFFSSPAMYNCTGMMYNVCLSCCTDTGVVAEAIRKPSPISEYN